MECNCEEKIEDACTDHKRGEKPNTLGKVLSAGLLRILRMNRSSARGIPADNYATYGKEIKLAMLEAESKKAEAVMELEKRRFIC